MKTREIWALRRKYETAPVSLFPVVAGQMAVASVALGWSSRFAGWLTSAGVAAALAGVMTVAFAGGWQAEVRRRRKVETRYLNLIHTDPLTGLVNRNAFKKSIAEIDTDHDSAAIVIFIDLDRFKEVNDTMGHKAGDDLLVSVASRISSALPENSVIARIGGDEFAATFPWNYEKSAEDYGRDLIQALAEAFVLDNRLVHIGASVGIAMGDTAVIKGSELLRRADIAMYAAKASGRGHYRIFDDALDQNRTREEMIRAEVGRAVVENQFRFDFQPLVNARTGELDSIEGLLCSLAPSLQNISSPKLLSIAEDCSQIHALTDWTINEAIATAVKTEPTPIAINISAVSVRQPDFASNVLTRLARAGVSPSRLIFQVAEEVLIDDIEATRQAFTQLRYAGIQIHLDDFGTGYASIGYLQSFDLDGLKLDKTFIQSTNESRKVNRITRSLVDFGHSLGMKIIVKGVENEWQACLLQLMGADVLQGLYLGTPVSLDDLIATYGAGNDGVWLDKMPFRQEVAMSRAV